MDEHEFLLLDRIAKIQSINEQYDLLNNAYISFSGGKDSVVLSNLIDLALPDNKIPRVFFNTGLDYKKIREFIFNLSKNDDRVKIVNSNVNIKKMLTADGYPFKSKQHSHNWLIFKKNYKEIDKYVSEINNDPELKNNYEYIHNLPQGIKTSIKYIFGIRERERDYLCYSYLDLP